MCRIRLSKSHKLIYYLYIKYLSGNKHILHIAICRFIHEEANTIYFCVFLRLDFFFFSRQIHVQTQNRVWTNDLCKHVPERRRGRQ